MTAQTDRSKLPFSLERPTSPNEAAQFCASLSNTMETLLKIIETETDLVRGGKLKQAGTSRRGGARLIQEYTRGMMCAKEHAVALGNLAPSGAQNLKRQHAEFQPVLRINLAVLSTAREVANNVVSSVAKAVGAQEKTTTYGPGGAAPAPPRPANGIAVNRSL